MQTHKQDSYWGHGTWVGYVQVGKCWITQNKENRKTVVAHQTQSTVLGVFWSPGELWIPSMRYKYRRTTIIKPFAKTWETKQAQRVG